jgi:hypothetical protein
MGVIVMHPWRRISPLLLIGLTGLLSLGCSGSHIKPKGHIVKGGQPFLAPEGSGFRVFFVPLEASGGNHYDSFAAAYDPSDGSFQVQGKDGNGMPPGKYRVDLQLMQSKEDLLGGRLLGKKSPYVFEVKSSSDNLIIDLDEAHFDAVLVQDKPTKTKPKPKRG